MKTIEQIFWSKVDYSGGPANGESSVSLAKEFRTSNDYINTIVRRVTWRHV